MDAVRSSAEFVDRVAVAFYLDGKAREEARDPRIAAIAARVLPLPPAERARIMFGFVRWAVSYREDLEGEEFDSAALTLLRGADDCDGSATLLLSLLLAAGLEARLRAVIYPDDPRMHLQVEVRWPGSELDTRAGPEGWVLADTILEGVELGEGAEAGRVNGAGDYLTLQRRPRRSASSAA